MRQFLFLNEGQDFANKIKSIKNFLILIFFITTFFNGHLVMYGNINHLNLYNTKYPENNIGDENFVNKINKEKRDSYEKSQVYLFLCYVLLQKSECATINYSKFLDIKGNFQIFNSKINSKDRQLIVRCKEASELNSIKIAHEISGPLTDKN